MATAGGVDGRVLRGRRNRDAVVASFLALIQEGDLRPTARAIAARAGVSVRSVFQHFDDLEQIFAEVGRLVVEELKPLLGPVDPELRFDERLDTFVARRRDLLEAIGPVARSARSREPFSAQLLANRIEFFETARRQCVEAFAPEILDHGGAERCQVADAVAIACSWTTWYGLREEMGLDPGQAAAVMRITVLRLLGAQCGAAALA